MFAFFTVLTVPVGLLLHLVAVGTVTAVGIEAGPAGNPSSGFFIDDNTNLPLLLEEFLAREQGDTSEGFQPHQQRGNSGNWGSLNPTGDLERIFLEFQQQLKDAQLQQLERQESERKKWQTSHAQLVELWKSAVATARKRFDKADQLWTEDRKESERQWEAFWDWAKTLLPSDLHSVRGMPITKADSQEKTVRKVKQIQPQEPKDLVPSEPKESGHKDTVKQALNEAEFLLSSLENQLGIIAPAKSETETQEPMIGEGFLQQPEEATPPEGKEPQTEEQSPKEAQVLATETLSIFWKTDQIKNEKEDGAASPAHSQVLAAPLKKEMERLILSIEESLKRVTYTTYTLRRALESSQRMGSQSLEDSRKLELGLQKLDGLNASFLSSNTAVKAELAEIDNLQLRQKPAQLEEILELQHKRIQVLKRWLLRLNVQHVLLLELVDKSGIDSPQADALPLQQSPALDAGVGSETPF